MPHTFSNLLAFVGRHWPAFSAFAVKMVAGALLRHYGANASNIVLILAGLGAAFTETAHQLTPPAKEEKQP